MFMHPLFMHPVYHPQTLTLDELIGSELLQALGAMVYSDTERGTLSRELYTI